jgi:hypothetical protein
MKKILALMLLLCAVFAGAQVPTTPNIGLYIPLHNTPLWDNYMNPNFSMLDNFLSGHATLPRINLGQLGITQYVDFTGTTPPALPAAGTCRMYYDLASNQWTGLNSAGELCSSQNAVGSAGHIGYYATTGRKVSPDACTTDGSGNHICASYTTNGIGTAKIDFPEGTSPGNPSAGFQRVFASSVDHVYHCLTSTGANCFSAVATGDVLLAPAGAQTVVQPVSGGSTTALSVNNFSNIRFAQQFNWTRSPAGTISVGANTITLTGCPAGIDTSNDTTAPYSVYIATTGTPEAVHVTGGTCAAGAGSGTIIFTAVNTHSAGYTVQSASGGIQEAINDAGSPDSKVIIAPTGANVNAIQVYATIFVAKNKIEISAQGAHVQCWTRSRCLQTGDTANANDWNTIRIRGLRFESMINIDGAKVTNVARTANITTVTTAAAHNFLTTGNAGGPDVIWLNYYTIASNISNYHGYCVIASVIDATHFTCSGQTGADFASSAVFGWTALNNAAIEDNGENTTMEDIVLRQTGSPKFHNFIVIDNDQAAKVTNLGTDSTGVRCTANFCGSVLVTRSDNGNAGILNVDKSEISLQCSGNGISHLSTNLLSIHDTVIQGFQQWGVKYEGGLTSVLMDGVYDQGDGCTNPLYSGSLGASVGLITTTATIKGANLPLGGLAPTFANTGATQRNYYVVPQESTAFAAGPFLYVGSALTNLAGTVTVQWPQVPGDGGGTVTYDLIITTGVNATAPYFGSATSIATGITSASCSNGICSFSDTLGAGSPYTYAANGHNGFGYAPDVWFWPSAIMLLSGGGVYPNVYMDQPVFVQSVIGPTGVSVSSRGCSSTIASIWVQCEVSGTGAGVALGATILQQQDNANNGASQFNLKGRTIYQYAGSHGPYDILTWVDSNLDRTLATTGNRPTADTADSAVGVDSTGTGSNAVGIGYRTPVSHSWYINSVFDGSSWKMRLTSSSLTLTVPVKATAFQTSTNCAAVGTSASPSVAACGSAAAGSFSCATSAVNTCTVNTTAVTANSQIFITQRLDTVTGTRLSVTCNAAANATIPNVNAVVAGTSFSFPLTQPVTNPQCYSYNIVN